MNRLQVICDGHKTNKLRSILSSYKQKVVRKLRFCILSPHADTALEVKKSSGTLCILSYSHIHQLTRVKFPAKILAFRDWNAQRFRCTFPRREWNKQASKYLLLLCLRFPSWTPALLGSMDSSCWSIRVLSRDFNRTIHQTHNVTNIGDLRIISYERHTTNTWSNCTRWQQTVLCKNTHNRRMRECTHFTLIKSNSKGNCLRPCTDSLFCELIAGSPGILMKLSAQRLPTFWLVSTSRLVDFRDVQN